MKRVLLIHLGDGDERCGLVWGGVRVEARRVGAEGDVGRARSLILAERDAVDAIGVEGFPVRLQLGAAEALHDAGRALFEAAGATPLVDGNGIRPLLERWAVTLAERAQPGIFARQSVLMVPGLNHAGLAQALQRQASHVAFADPLLFFGFPRLPGVGSAWSVGSVASATLGILRRSEPARLRPAGQLPAGSGVRSMFRRAQVLAGEAGFLLGLPPELLRGKTLAVEAADDAEIEAMREAGARILVTLMPSLVPGSEVARHGAATIEAVLAALRSSPSKPLNEDTYLDLIADVEWHPAVRYLRPEEAGVNRFAFVIHPLDIGFIHRHSAFRWTRFLPDGVVERLAARVPPMYISRITGAQSASTGQRVEGHLISLGATPRQIMRRSAQATYRQLNRAARMAEARGARLMGLGAFTSVVGDAGVTVAHESPIAITSGNSLTVAATLEAAKVAARRMGSQDLSRGRAMVIGATGSIGSVCARMIAQAVRDVALVSIEPEKLIELKRTILRETPGAQVTVATRAGDLVAECDLIVTATSGFGQRVVDISRCKPGAIICDVARPPDVTESEAALRPDVLVIESGEVVIPGDIDFGYDIGLPPGVSYACLAETALLAMAGRFESFTLGRQLSTEKVKEIYRLFKHHGFKLAGLRSLGRYLTDDDLEEKRQMADRLRADAALFERARRDAAQRLETLPAMSKGIRAS